MSPACEPCREWISGALDGCIDGREAAQLEVHLEECPACREFQGRLESSVVTLRELEEMEASEGFLALMDDRLASEAAAEAAAPCPDYAEWISGAQDGALLPAEQERLDEHLQLCGSCEDYRRRLAAFLPSLAALDLILPSQDFHAILEDDLDACARLESAEQPAERRPPSIAPFLRARLPGLIKLAAALLFVAGALWLLRSAYIERDRRVVINPPLPPTIPEQPPRVISPQTPEGPGPRVSPEPPPEQAPERAPPPPSSAGPVKPPQNNEAEPLEPPAQSPARPKAETPTVERRPQPPRLIDRVALARLIRQIRDKKTPALEREQALVALGDYPVKEAYELLALAATDGLRSLPQSRGLPQAAAEALPRLNNETAARILWQAAIDSAQLGLAAARFRDDEAVAALARLSLECQQADRSLAVIAGLGWPHNRAAVPLLSAAAENRKLNALRRRACALSLGRIDEAECTEVLARLATPENRSRVPSAVREGAAIALGDARTPRGLEVLTIALTDREGVVRRSAARSIGRYREPKAIDLLIRRLSKEKKNDRVQNAILTALFELTGQSFPSLREWKTWWDEARKSLIDMTTVERERPKGTMEPLGSGAFGIPWRPRGALFLVDCSYSMGLNGKFELVKEELAAAIADLPGNAAFNIMMFDDRQRCLLGGGRLGLVFRSPDTLRQAQAALARQRISKAPTDLAAAIERGLSLAEVDTIYLITDGNPTRGGGARSIPLIEERALAANRMRAAPAVIHTVGVYSDQSLFLDLRERVVGNEGPQRAFLRSLARRSRGFFLVNRPE